LLLGRFQDHSLGDHLGMGVFFYHFLNSGCFTTCASPKKKLKNNVQSPPRIKLSPRPAKYAKQSKEVGEKMEWEGCPRMNSKYPSEDELRGPSVTTKLKTCQKILQAYNQ